MERAYFGSPKKKKKKKKNHCDSFLIRWQEWSSHGKVLNLF
jgi:hypothetical protein